MGGSCLLSYEQAKTQASSRSPFFFAVIGIELNQWLDVRLLDELIII
jgi:hypothetical protein